MTMIATSMSSEPNTNAAATNENAAKAKRKDAPPLALEDTLRDLAILRASSVDLAAVLASTMAPAPVSTTITATAIDTSVSRSYEFARAARSAIKISNRGDVEAQVERVNDVREKLEEVAAGLRDG
ncbi:hypothetical protein H4582DRAFT_267979 [Lactarius indigo]|nr:hypothetical protein H4582DRAFT_267979 [Lactarius indigo]